MDYKGWKEIRLDEERLAALYEGKDIELDLLDNEYLIAVDNFGYPIDYFQKTKAGVKKIKFPSIGNEFTGVMKPRNPQQYCALDMLKNKDIPIKLITGRFGSGKSMACIVAALEAVQRGEFQKIVFVRNNVQVKDTDQLGALPGDADDKMLPYLMPFADHCGGTEGLMRLIENKQLEVIPLGYLRGRSIRNAILYSMEAENLSKEHIQLIMGRIDEGSQLWMDGDIKQRDKTSFERSRGLETMIDRLKGEPMFGYIHLMKSERSEVAALADKLD